ncbi:MAG: phosphotransferase, partial [Spirochaetales bacterium]|nr:phosphotransferase [Spirochaetales bacterium]
EKDPVKRVESAKEDIEYLISLKDEASRLSAMNLPLRVTHNDTKTSNVLVDKDTLEPLAVIDLDTVMPGLLCHDFADSIRYSANKVAEDEKEYWKAGLDLDMYRAYAKGFIPAVSPIITEEEKTTLVLGVITIVYEQAVRFLDDYLAGDVYYHTDYPEHNLVRTRTQTGLLRDMLEQREEMERIAADPELYRL